MAELIVGKNRHGSVGSVNLCFRKELGQFANYTPVAVDDSGKEDDAFAAFGPG
jgi:replicative DNA helicase